MTQWLLGAKYLAWCWLYSSVLAKGFGKELDLQGNFEYRLSRPERNTCGME